LDTTKKFWAASLDAVGSAPTVQDGSSGPDSTQSMTGLSQRFFSRDNLVFHHKIGMFLSFQGTSAVDRGHYKQKQQF
jgi:hypothetical protein